MYMDICVARRYHMFVSTAESHNAGTVSEHCFLPAVSAIEDVTSVRQFISLHAQLGNTSFILIYTFWNNRH
jgi:hypothetical protein